MIFVDGREVPSEICGILDAMHLTYTLKMLPTCDFIITGKNGVVGIEHKGPVDYIQSLTSGRLNNQLVQMSRTFKHSVVIVDGSINQAAQNSGVRRNAVYSSLVGAFIKHSKDGESGSVSLIMVENNWDLALVLQYIQQKMDDPSGVYRDLVLVVPHIGGDIYLSQLCCIPGIGETTGLEIKKFFPTMELLVRATPDELTVCKGVGKTTAKTIYDALRTTASETQRPKNL